MKTTLILIRHAETEWNREQRVQGFKDSPLSEKGLEQAKRLAPRLAGEKIKAAYCSDSGRCVKTAELALNGSNLDVKYLESLRERNLGAWEGLAWPTISADPSADTEAYRWDPTFRPPDGESWNDLQQRVAPIVDQVLKDHPSETVAIFTSGGTLRAFIHHVLNVPGTAWGQWRTWNTGVTTLEHQAGIWRVVRFNDTCHLN